MALTRLGSTKDFARIWFSWKKQAILVFVVIVFAVMAFSYLYTPQYESNAKVLILPRTSEGVIITSGNDEDRVAPVSIEDINTEMELLTSYDVIKETVSSFKKGAMGLNTPSAGWYDKIKDLIKRAFKEVLIFLGLKERLSPFDANVQLLRESLAVEPVAMSNIILITLTAEMPKAAKIVLNRLLQVYVKHHKDVFSKSEGYQFYHDQAEEYRRKLEIAEKKLRSFRSKWNIVNLKQQNSANIELLSELNNELKHIEISYIESRSKIAAIRRAMSEEKQNILINKEMRTIPAIVELEKSLVPLYIKRSEILKSYTPSSREYQSINSQIEILRKEIRNEAGKAVRTDELELDALLEKKKSLQEKLSEFQKEANNLSQKEMMVQALKREVDLNRKNYMLYASKTQDERIYQERNKRDLANVNIANSATLPLKPAFPNRFLMLVVSFIAGISAALGIPFILEFLDHRIKTSNEVEDLLSLTVTTVIPEK